MIIRLTPSEDAGPVVTPKTQRTGRRAGGDRMSIKSVGPAGGFGGVQAADRRTGRPGRSSIFARAAHICQKIAGRSRLLQGDDGPAGGLL
jgi:hypothetical protein